ncbi:MAG TPA: methylmalonyl-CoA mutase family protein [Xanthobacteraceae bacterium]|nr:methylmalonyl-CoA mutase family protein [Xanthobacteraceae bacterium]
MTDPDNLPLAADFPPATRAQWRKLVDAVLKGAPFERLVSKTYDGLAIEPLAARRPDARPIAGRPGSATWDVLARIDHPDPARANEIALRELNNGAGGLTLVFADSLGSHGFGVPANEQALARTLEGVRFDAGIVVDIDLPPFARELPQIVAKIAGQSAKPATARLRYGYDPLTAIAISGKLPLAWNKTAPLMAGLIRTLADAGFKGPFAVGDGRAVHDAGGSEAQELAFALAAAVAYLRALEAGGMTLDTARDAIYFRLTADAEQFPTIAKFRALRKLWAHVERSCGLSPKPVLVAAETAWRMMTRRDPQVNILRTAIAVFAAALGGADTITVLPFTAASGLPDRFARRVARNTQLLLAEEAHVGKVADPAAGSGAMESLTDELCEAAWALFREIEAAGGPAAALETGLIQKKIAGVRAKREAAIASRQDALTGVSIFPNLQEAEARIDAAFPPAKPAPLTSPVAPLVSVRLAAPFEALRDASDLVLAKSGARPKIFLATLGSQAEFTPRATFARNFFEAGGIEAVSGDVTAPSPLGREGRREAPGWGENSASHPRPLPTASGGRGENDSAAAAVSAFKNSGAALACLCSSDKAYDKEAVTTAQALKAAGVKHLYLAGRPGEREAALRAGGVQSFVYEGCDALATLKGAYDILGIDIA